MTTQFSNRKSLEYRTQYSLKFHAKNNKKTTEFVMFRLYSKDIVISLTMNSECFLTAHFRLFLHFCQNIEFRCQGTKYTYSLYDIWLNDDHFFISGSPLHPDDIISNHTVHSQNECLWMCLQAKSTCVGFNYRASKSNKNVINCQLSNKSYGKNNVQSGQTGEWKFYQDSEQL